MSHRAITVLLPGSLLVAAVDPKVYLAGASGGVYALLAAHLAELVIHFRIYFLLRG